MNRLRKLLAAFVLLSVPAVGCGTGAPPRPQREVILSSEAVDEKVAASNKQPEPGDKAR